MHRQYQFMGLKRAVVMSGQHSTDSEIALIGQHACPRRQQQQIHFRQAIGQGHMATDGRVMTDGVIGHAGQGLGKHRPGSHYRVVGQ